MTTIADISRMTTAEISALPAAAIYEALRNAREEGEQIAMCVALLSDQLAARAVRAADRFPIAA